MLNQNLDAGSAAVCVGYESASQFSREYSRLFGAPPQRDIKRMRLALLPVPPTFVERQRDNSSWNGPAPSIDSTVARVAVTRRVSL